MKFLITFGLIALAGATPIIKPIDVLENGAEVYHKVLEVVSDVSIYDSTWDKPTDENINSLIRNGTNAELGQFP